MYIHMGSLFSSPEPPPPTMFEVFMQFLWVWMAFSMLRRFLEERGFDFESRGRCNRWKRKKKKGDEEERDESLGNVIGLKSVKREIHYFMDFIKEKEKYKSWDVNLPRGILLAGPPGTGKTLLVKTMAKELDLPVVSAAGSEFVEKYVGVGASRIRRLFQKAKRKGACIIFIDEIDAIGSSREKMMFQNSERSSTLNQLLVEMDGFDSEDNIIVFAATNMIKHLDGALTRSGRFDKKVYFDPPNVKEREKLYELYLKNMELPDGLSFSVLSERSAGMTGADIANIANQAKINAIQGGRVDAVLTEKDIQDAIDEVMIGREKRERMMTVEERKRVAHHEAGHALMGFILSDSSPPVKVSIIPRGEAALGFSQPKPENKKLYTEQAILAMICVLLGGRVGEKIVYDCVSTGAADDIEKISKLVHQYICSWGMNETIGPINPSVVDVFSECSSNEIFKQARLIVAELERFTLEILQKHKEHIVAIAQKLLKDETITLRQIKVLVPKSLENSMTPPVICDSDGHDESVNIRTIPRSS